MPPKYERKTLRASWSAADLDEAMMKVRNKEMGTNEAARTYGIPSRTLRRHLITGRPKGSLGRRPVFCEQYEKKLVAHIKKLEMVGFAPERKDFKEMAYQLAQKMKVKNPFSEESETAGNVWFNGFMSRNPEISQRKSEGLSLARAYGVNRQDVKEFFDLLEKTYKEHDFANHPEDVYNMDESGIQVNNKPGKVIATKGAKDVYTLTSSEKGENVTVVACCNAQGNFLPPVLIHKGTYSKPQFSEGLPPGSQVFMNKKSSYINSDLFMKWFEEVFLRHKSSRQTLLILDGHSSHSNNIRLLEVATENNVTIICLPSHTTHALQPLDRAFFRPLKVYFAQEAKSWMVMNKDKKLTRYDVSKLIGKAWGKAATVSNGVSALKSCEIFPFNPNAIPDHYFSLSDSLIRQNLVDPIDDDRTPSPSVLELEEPSGLDTIAEPQPGTSRQDTAEPQPGPSGLDTIAEPQWGPSRQDNAEPQPRPSGQDTTEPQPGTSRQDTAELQPGTSRQDTAEPQPGPSKPERTPSRQNTAFEPRPRSSEVTSEPIATNSTQETPKKIELSESNDLQETPTKVLAEIYPVPKLPAMMCKRKQKAVILTSPENIQKKILIAEKKKPKTKPEKPKRSQKKEEETEETRPKSNKGKTSAVSTKRKITVKKDDVKNMKKIKKEKQKKPKKGPKMNKKGKVITSSSSESNEEVICMSEEEISDEDVNKCAECTEDYYQMQSTDEWIQCPSCLGWLHESCTMYNPLCNRCGRQAKREAMMNK